MNTPLAGYAPFSSCTRRRLSTHQFQSRLSSHFAATLTLDFGYRILNHVLVGVHESTEHAVAASSARCPAARRSGWRVVPEIPLADSRIHLHRLRHFLRRTQ